MSTHTTADTNTAAPAVKGVPNTGLLRFGLSVDGILTGANGLLYLALAGVIDSGLGVDASILRGAGAFFVVYAAVIGLLAVRPRVPRLAVMTIVVGNAVWAIDSMVAAIAGWYSPTTVGTVWIVLQGLLVGAFAVVQYVGLKRAA